MNHNVLKKASDIVNACEEGCFSYLDKKGYPHSATRSKMKSDGILSCYFSTNRSGNMANAILKDARSSVCFLRDGDNVSLMGDAYIVDDQKMKEALWLDWFSNHYPLGPTDPEYCVIKFITKYTSLWVDREVSAFDIEENVNV